MTRSPEDVARWQHMLSGVFRGPSGIVGEKVVRFHDAERRTSNEGIERFRCFGIASDSFMDFAIHSLDLLASPPDVYHLLRVPLFVASVSRLRSSAVLFWKGYYFDAAALLRGIFENVVQCCACAHGWVDLNAWIDPGEIDLNLPPREVTKQMEKRRRKCIQLAEGRVFRADSGMSKEDQEHLAQMVDLMHMHVHRAEMHLAHLVCEVRETGRPVIVFPTWNSHTASHYGNISLFLSWALLRLISYAVPLEQRSASWIARHDVLDGYLRYFFESWEQPLGPAIVRLLDTKFDFNGAWPPPAAAPP